MARPTLNIVSWNIRKAVGLDWRRNPGRILRVLQELGPDIVLLQEADKRLAPRPPALPLDMVARAGWTTIDADPATPSIGHHGNAILIRPGIEVRALAALDLPGLEPRGAVIARLEGAFGPLTVGGMHLGLRQADRRRQVAMVLKAALGLGGPVLLGGDLNEWRADMALPEGWQVVAPGPSFHAARPILHLDRFLVGPGVSVLGADVLARVHSQRASDHLPIRLHARL